VYFVVLQKFLVQRGSVVLSPRHFVTIALVLLALQTAVNSSDYQRGIALVEKGQPQAAVPLLTRAAEASPRDARNWKALGVAYAAQKLYNVAESPFQRACELDPSLDDACYYYGRALYALNRFEGSLQVLAHAAGRDPKSWKIHLGIAQALEALGRPEEALNEFTKTLALSQNSDPKPGVAYGLFLIRQGRMQDAIAPLDEVLKRFPSSAEAHIHLGRALLEQGKTAGAIGHFAIAVTIDPTSAQAHLLLAKGYVRAGRASEAQVHFEAAARYEDGSRIVK
jgi:tetratricopeptide (TPR) repeat protein